MNNKTNKKNIQKLQEYLEQKNINEDDSRDDKCYNSSNSTNRFYDNGLVKSKSKN